MNDLLQNALGFPRRAVRFAQRRARALVYTVKQPHSLNIGGGPSFWEPGWYNLEEVTSRLNPRSFRLSPTCVFPPADGSLRTVYTAHALEHLDTPTFARMLVESRRALRGDGKFIIKIPDFDYALECWRRREPAFFASSAWAIDSVTPTWKNRRVCDCVDHRAALIFCGFWNAEYGHHFRGATPDNRSAYFGPAVVDVEFLRRLIDDNTPNRISARLRKVVTDNERDYTFSHQNAWGREELKQALAEAGFRVKTFDRGKIVAGCQEIPGIDWMFEQSLYCWAEKA